MSTEERGQAFGGVFDRGDRLIFDERARARTWRLLGDLVRDNPGPLAELWNLDKGCWVVALWRDTPDTDRVYPELVEGLRFRVRYG